MYLGPLFCSRLSCAACCPPAGMFLYRQTLLGISYTIQDRTGPGDRVATNYPEKGLTFDLENKGHPGPGWPCPPDDYGNSASLVKK